MTDLDFAIVDADNHYYDPDDLLQEICWRAYDRFPTFDSEKGKFRGWIFGIANNVLREALQDLRRRPPRASHGRGSSRPSLGNLPDDATTISKRVARDESLRQFIAELETLNEDERRLLVFRGLEGLSHQEVADLMGLSQEATEKRWQRLQKKIAGLAGAQLDLFTP